MAPFSYFRTQHRRAGSTSTSDSPNSPHLKGSYSPFATASPSGPDGSAHSPSSFRHSAIPSPTIESPISPLPPTLPPIPRVASKHEQQHRSHSFSKSDVGPPRPNVHSERLRNSDITDQQRETIKAELANSAAPILPQIPRVATRRFPGLEPLKIKTAETSSETGYRRRDFSEYQPEPFPSSRSTHAESAAIGLTETQYDSQPWKTLPTHSFTQDTAPRPATPPIFRSSNELHPPPHTNSRRPPSPSSSLSSFQKSVSSSNHAADSPPQPSRPVQGANSTTTRTTKPRMNLLNPVSLLRRRRTARDAETISDTPAMDLPEDYDPRIRGKGVHDFSAPRPRRYHSTNAADSLSLPLASDPATMEYRQRQSSTLGPPAEVDKAVAQEHDHVTVFRENFDDNTGEDSSALAVNRESLANSSFLARMSRRLDFDSSDLTSSNMDSISDSPQKTPSPAGERTSKSTVGAPSVRMSSDRSTARSSISNDTKATSPPSSPPLKHQRGSIAPEPPFLAEGLPKHFSSSASRTSRFSFQLNSEATLEQEKALEEKGKERAAKEQQYDSDDAGFSDSDDDVTNYGDYDDAPYEEEIPMVNAVEDDDPNESLDQQDHDANDAKTISADPLNTQITEAGNMNQRSTTLLSDEQGLQDQPQRTTLEPGRSVDSMYFDDGLINEPTPDETQQFDESLFDSPIEPYESHASLNGKYTKNGGNWETAAIHNPADDLKGLGLASVDSTNDQPKFASQLDQRESAPLIGLEAYHDALASAANKAEANGRFHRKPSVDISVPDVQSDLGSKVSHMSGFEVDPVDWAQSNFDDNDLDGLEDDQMVAAANAEVLASEDSDFYGQEFGFYGGSSDPDMEMYSGGFFGAAPDDLKRSVSGMNASREPNLTPITERSEFSTRNSFISLPAYGSNQSAPNSAISRNDTQFPSPVLGLKELAASMNMDEDDMTLSQLIKLRKETFGAGGGGTIASPSNSAPSGSPLAVLNLFPVETVEEEDTEHDANGWSSPDDEYYEQLLDDTELDDTLVPDEFQPSSQPAISTTTLSMQMPPLSGSAQSTPQPLSAFKTQTFDLTSKETDPASSPPLPKLNAARHVASSSATRSSQFPSPPTPSSYVFPSPTTHSAPTSPMPMPSPSMVQKFASRPPASSASYSARHQRRSMGSAGGASGDSVAYVMEDSKWYLERRRRLSSGELIVVGRELVEGGTI